MKCYIIITVALRVLNAVFPYITVNKLDLVCTNCKLSCFKHMHFIINWYKFKLELMDLRLNESNPSCERYMLILSPLAWSLPFTSKRKRREFKEHAYMQGEGLRAGIWPISILH